MFRVVAHIGLLLSRPGRADDDIIAAPIADPVGFAADQDIHPEVV